MERGHRRTFPTSSLDFLSSQIKQSRIQPLREHEVSFIKPQEFTKEVYEDVKYSTMPLANHRNRTLTKFENRYPVSNSIALYDMHHESLNDENRIGTYLQRQQRNKAESKVVQKEDFRLPMSQYLSYDADLPGVYKQSTMVEMPFLTTEGEMQPRLPAREGESEMLVGGGMKYGTGTTRPRLIDERMIWHTSDKQYSLPSDKSQLAIALQPNNNPYIQERNQRQKEADDAFLRRHKTNRWAENKAAYLDRQYLPHYGAEDLVAASGTGVHQESYAPRLTIDRHSIQEATPGEAYATERIPLTVGGMKTLTKIYEGHYNPLYERGVNTLTADNLIDQRREHFNDAPKDSGMNWFVRILDPIARFLKWRPTNISTDDERIHDSLKQNTRALMHRAFGTDYTKPFGRFDYKYLQETPERFVYKPNYMLVIKNDTMLNDMSKDVSDYPIDMYTRAFSYQTVDPTGWNKLRQVIYLDDEKVYIVQRRGEEPMFTVVELPIDIIDERTRNKFGHIKEFSKRSKVAELDYEDHIAFSDYVVRHPEKQERIQIKDLGMVVRHPDITYFDNPKIEYVDYSVYNLDNANKRQKLPNTSLKGRTDLHQDIEKTVAMESSKEPIDTAVKTEGFRTAMSKTHYNFRTKGLKRGAFD